MTGSSVSSMLADLLAVRVADLTSPENRAGFAAYLDRLEQTHGNDRAMRPVIDDSRAALAAALTPAPTLTPHPEVASHGSAVPAPVPPRQAPRPDTAVAAAGVRSPAGASHQ